EITNEELEPSGLYMTHLFLESQVILSPSWLDHLEPIEMKNLNLLRLFRPSTGDLLLTKMMRVDPQDRQDLRFLCSHLPHEFDLRGFLATARVPDVEEIREAFDVNSEWLLSTDFNEN